MAISPCACRRLKQRPSFALAFFGSSARQRSQHTSAALVFLTNNFKLSANTIAAIYKNRWQIELFFKALKQNLKIKTFVGTSSNAVRTQIWIALIAMLLLRFLQMSSRFGWSLSNLVALLRMNLFTHRDLMDWLNQPTPRPRSSS